MRVHLKGFGTPIPQVALPDPSTDETLPPKLFTLVDGVPFLKAESIALGYTNFEVFCIGAVGGRGGGVPLPYSTEAVNYGGGGLSFGGAGGGGGLHRVSGLLSILPDACEVVVGQPGEDGIDGDGGEILPEMGQEGGASSFNGTTCRASGGKGGDPTPMESVDELTPIPAVIPGGSGGEGGAGDSTIAGGGGDGGFSTLSPNPEIGYVYDAADDGSWNGTIGYGGGGGRGGTYRAPIYFPSSSTIRFPEVTHLAGHGGQGSFSYGDTSVYGSRQARLTNTTFGGTPFIFYKQIIAGSGGGAKVNQFLRYGSQANGYNPNGAVLIRLTKIE